MAPPHPPSPPSASDDGRDLEPCPPSSSNLSPSLTALLAIPYALPWNAICAHEAKQQISSPATLPADKHPSLGNPYHMRGSEINIPQARQGEPNAQQAEKLPAMSV